jgi:hypothetical protein
MVYIILFMMSMHNGMETINLINTNIHTYNTRRKMDIHIQSYSTAFYARSVIHMGTKLYNKHPGYIKEIDTY